ncbi:uncharacterized protein DS421_1g12820 [Arachis hypogaea]|nr:uncharacterized protein DS421_1g12820 [Arachis hypogaea]
MLKTPKSLGIMQQKQGRGIEELKKHHWTFKKVPPSLRWIHSLFSIFFLFSVFNTMFIYVLCLYFMIISM